MGSEGVSRDDVCATISSLPGQLSHDDVEDFFSLAHYYASRTPQSFRKVLSLTHTHTHALTLTVCVMRCSDCILCCLGLSQSDVW